RAVAMRRSSLWLLAQRSLAFNGCRRTGKGFSFLRAGFERHIKRLGGIAQRLAVQNIFMRQSCNRFCQVAQNLGEQRIVKMHANRFALLVGAGYLQAQRYTVLVEVSVESRSMRECSDVELVGVFHRDFRFIENRPGHNNCTWALAS